MFISFIFYVNLFTRYGSSHTNNNERKTFFANKGIIYNKKT